MMDISKEYHLRIKFMDDAFKPQNREKSGREGWKELFHFEFGFCFFFD